MSENNGHKEAVLSHACYAVDKILLAYIKYSIDEILREWVKP